MKLIDALDILERKDCDPVAVNDGGDLLTRQDIDRLITYAVNAESENVEKQMTAEILAGQLILKKITAQILEWAESESEGEAWDVEKPGSIKAPVITDWKGEVA
jgi:hypothetical protein